MKDQMLLALKKEIELRKEEFTKEVVETIYFGGGTPSLLSVDELQSLLDVIYSNFKVSSDPEITLEANPDDLSKHKIKLLSESPVNRLSIGIQSFFEDDLKLMNRAHNADEAIICVEEATKYFKNISLDLIYGVPGMSHEKWIKNIDVALSYGIPHISSYALTVEPKTALESFIKNGKVHPPDDEQAQEQFHILIDRLEANDFIHYELSNFGKAGYFSKNNTAYWLGKRYLGIGPSAHSYDGLKRSWNLSNNAKYIESIKNNTVPSESEILKNTDKYNEYVMTGLRTIWGVSLKEVDRSFGHNYKEYLLKQSHKYIEDKLLLLDDEVLKTTKKGKFLTDGIASDLFILNL